MPKRSVWLIRAALVYLVLGVTGGALLIIQTVVNLHPGLSALRPLHIEFLFFGFMVQLAFGVALWILPRSSKPQSMAPGWWGGAVLSGGIWLVGMGGIFERGAMMLTGRFAEFVAIVILARHVWPRVRALRHARRDRMLRSHGFPPHH